MKVTSFIQAALIVSVFASCGGGEQTPAVNNSTKKPGGTQSSFGNGTGAGPSGGMTASSAFVPNLELSIKLTPFVPPYSSLGESGRRILESRLNGAISKVAYGGSGMGNPKFIVGPTVSLLSENVTATAPPKFVNTYEVTLLAVDVDQEMVLSSYAFEVKGIGDSPSKSFINAFREYKFEDEAFFTFLQDAETKAYAYYEANCAAILDEAEAEAARREYDAAYALVSTIPREASACFESVNDAKERFFAATLAENCNELLSKMEAELGKMNDPSVAGFNAEAMSYFALIDRSAPCFEDAQRTYKSYISKLNPQARIDWEREQKEWELKVSQIEADQAFRRDSVMANFEYLKNKDNMKAKADIEGNKKLLNKYKYDQLPGIRKIFHLGDLDPFDGSEE